MPAPTGRFVSRFILPSEFLKCVRLALKFEKKNRNEQERNSGRSRNFRKSLFRKNLVPSYNINGKAKRLTSLGDGGDSKSEYSIPGFFKFWIGRRIVRYFRIIKASVSVSVDPVATSRFRILQVTEVSFCKRERAGISESSSRFKHDPGTSLDTVEFKGDVARERNYFLKERFVHLNNLTFIRLWNYGS